MANRMSTRSHTGTGKRSSGRLARTLVAMLCTVFVVLGAMSVAGVEPACAVEFDDGSGYADAFIGDTGWKSDLITDAVPEAETGAHGEDLVGDLSTFFLNLGTIIIALSFFFCVLRFAVRAVYMMVAQNNPEAQNKFGNEKSGLWVLIMTASERSSKKMSDEWFVPMLKETFLFLGIGICAGFLVILIASIAGFLIGQLGGQASDAGYGTFNMSGITVQTK